MKLLKIALVVLVPTFVILCSMAFAAGQLPKESGAVRDLVLGIAVSLTICGGTMALIARKIEDEIREGGE